MKRLLVTLVCACAGIAVALPASAMFFVDDLRWVDGSSLDPAPKKRGDPVKLGWSIPPDGTKINDWGHCPDQINNLNAYLKREAGENYTDMFKFIFKRFGEVSGLQFVEVKDDGANVVVDKRSLPHKQGDVRVVASDMTLLGYSGAGWCNAPTQGKCCVVHMSTSMDTSYNDMLKLIMHEVGHSVGLGHQTIYATTDAKEEFRAPNGDYGSVTGFVCSTGPQFDDIYAMHRLYGDRWERDGGNDTIKTSAEIGQLEPGQSYSIGADTHGITVKPDQTDFLSIDGSTDRDNFTFTLTAKASVTVTVTPKGPAYAYAPDCKGRVVFDASKQNDLLFDLCRPSGVSIAHCSGSGPGGAETVTKVLAAGKYIIIVKGTQDKTQFYRLDVAAEPT